MFPPPPRLPPRRPIVSQGRPSRADSIDLLDTVPPAPTPEMLMTTSSTQLVNKIIDKHVNSSTQVSTNERSSSNNSPESKSIQIPSQRANNPSILVSNTSYFESSSGIVNENNTYLTLSSSRTPSIPHSASAPNGFNAFLHQHKTQTLPNNFTPSFHGNDDASLASGSSTTRFNHTNPSLGHLTASSRSYSSSGSLSSFSSSSRSLSHPNGTFNPQVKLRQSVSTSLQRKSSDDNLIDLSTLEDEDVRSLFDPLSSRERSSSPSSSVSRPSRSSNRNSDEVDTSSSFKDHGKNTMKILKTDKVIEFESKLVLGKKASLVTSTASLPKTSSERNSSKRLVVERRLVRTCGHIEPFYSRVKGMRMRYHHDDFKTNTGLIVSPVIETQRDECDSVKLVINSKVFDNLKDLKQNHPVVFTCNVSTSVEHIISHTVCSIMEDAADVDFDAFILKVFGRNEYLASDSILQDYSYVLECHKFDRDVRLTLVKAEDVERVFARTEEDDRRITQDFSTESLIPNRLLQEFSLINFTRIKILIETLDREVEKSLNNCRYETIINYTGVKQAVQAIASQLSNMESEDLRLALEDFTERIKSLSEFKSSSGSTTTDIDSNQMQLIETSVHKIYSGVKEIIQLYSEAFPVDFTIISSLTKSTSRIKASTDCSEDILCYIGQLSQPCLEWHDKFRKFFCLIELFHGEKKIAWTKTQTQYLSTSFLKFDRIQFEEWITFEGFPLKKLPRETCLYFSIIGIEYVDPDNVSTTATGFAAKREVNSLLSLSIVRLFDSSEKLEQGPKLLSMWDQRKKPFSETDKFSINCSCYSKDAPVLTIRLPEFEYDIKFPGVSKRDPNSYVNLRPGDSAVDTTYQDMRGLNSEIQTSIYQVLNRDPVIGLQNPDKDLLWNNRGNLITIPSALPKVLLSTKSWDYESLTEIYELIDRWSELSVFEALQLLQPSFPDTYVRRKGVEWITSLGYDGLICDFLPQIIQAIRFEPYLDSPLVMYLLETSLKSVRVAHQLYWLLKENVYDPLLGFRCSVILNALLIICGSALKSMIEKEETFQSKLSIVNENVKSAKENSRLTTLLRNLDPVDDFLKEIGFLSLPLSPSFLVKGLVIQNCSYFTSKTLPLKLSFLPSEANCPDSVVEAMFKIGDDLRQDTLTMQMIGIMDKLWLKEGLDLKIVTFSCVSTDDRKGFVEMVSKALTLRQIQMESGIQGTLTLNDRCVNDWLRKHNTHELDYVKARENFVRSCAGYAVATYILGVCDRHNDNIMVTTNGHLFHIDFGKFLGDAQMMGSIKRDRVPFILSKEMLYVINGGSDSSKDFQFFVELSCQAFNIVRRHSNLFLTLFSLMTCSSIPGVTQTSVKYLHTALLPDLSESQAMAAFTQKIDESSKALSVQLNFFVHSLAQLRFTGDHNDNQRLLSFVPRTCTKDTESKILSFVVVTYFKKYDPDKEYFFVVRVIREDCQRDPQRVSRSYHEFYEFYQKLTSIFPLAPLSLSRGSSFGRSNTQDVAEKRKTFLNNFLHQLTSNCAEEISHSDLVYTFFQPLLRDQELEEMMVSGNQKSHKQDIKRNRSLVASTGQVSLSLTYKNNSLIIMIRHAKGLVSRVSPDKQPNVYVKTKLTPDPKNDSKRKTKIVNRNSNPSFMELIAYCLPFTCLQQKVLNVSVWESASSVHGSIYLGAAFIPLGEIDLSHDSVSWYPLN